MILKDDHELACSREKLRELEAYYQKRSEESSSDLRLLDLTLRSLRRLITQMKEDIARYDARHAASHRV